MRNFVDKYTGFRHKYILSEVKYRILIFDENFESANRLKKYFRKFEFFIKIENKINLHVCKIIQPDFIIINISTFKNNKKLLLDGKFYDFRGRYIILTNIDNTPDREVINYIESGAADVLDKTTRYRYLLAKIRSILITLKSKINDESTIINQDEKDIVFGPFTIKKPEGKLIYKDSSLCFSNNEFSLFMMLIDKPNTIISRDKLYKMLLNTQYDGANRSIDNTIFRIRKKLEELNITQFKIKSIRGRGYLFYIN